MRTSHQLHLPAILAFTALLSCSDDLYERAVDPNTSPINLSGQIVQQNATRANEQGFVTGDRVGIYVVDYTPSDSPEGGGWQPGDLAASGIRAQNVLYTFNGDSYTWSSPTTIYWRDEQTPVSIYGYYPGQNYISNPTAWQFSVQTDQSTPAANGSLSGYEQSDLLWGKEGRVAFTEEQIVIKYHHILAGVRVVLKKGTGISATEWEKLEKIVLVDHTVTSATVDLSTGMASPNPSEGGEPIRMASPPSGESEGVYRAVVIPQTVAAGKQLLSITLDGQTYSHTLTTAMNYLSGKLHNFTMTVNKSEQTGDYQISVTDNGITPWVNDEQSHQFTAMAYLTVHCPEYGKLKEYITAAGYDYKTVQNLKVTGEIDADDYHLMAGEMPELRHLNLRDAVSRHVFVGHNWDTGEDYYEDDVIVGFYGNQTLRSIVVPSSTKTIGGNAFRETRLMYSTLEVPEGVTKIGGGAFSYNEYNGVEVVLPATLDTIEGSAFVGCHYKCELKLTDNITYIGEAAFKDCPNFYGVFHVPSKLKELKEGMFAGLGSNGSFTGEIEIPQGITEIPNGYWGGVFGVSLKNRVSVVLPAGIKRLMSGFGNLNSIHFNDDLEVIGGGAFYAGNLHLSIKLPPSLREIGYRAFCECALEGEVIVPENCLEIGGDAFCGNDITKVTLPSRLEEISGGMFRQCWSLREVTIPRYVENIGEEAFWDCVSLQTLISLNPEPPAIGGSTFRNVPFDKCVLQVPEASVETYRHTEGWSNFKNITPYRELAFNIPEIVALDKGSTLSGILRAEGAWEVAECPNWVTVSPASGTYKEELTVIVKAMSGEGEREGRIVFRLKDKDYSIYTTVRQLNSGEYREDQTFVLQQASAGAPSEIPIFIVGEGYTAEEIASGQYQTDVREQMEHLFSCEPYKTYRDYFTVSTAIACSPEHGLDGRTRFNSGIDYYNGVFYTDERRVWEYAESHAQSINDGSHSRALVMMLINTSQCLNAVKLDDDGYALAILGKSTDTYPFSQHELVLRDVGGRAFGHLASEATNHFTFLKACTCPGCRSWEEYQRGRALGWYENVSLSSKMNEAPWAHLIFHPTYSACVDMYEGGYNHARGTYRSENMSVMGNVPIPYFNTISRQSIVKRIMDYSGETFTLDKFFANDKIELPETIDN